MQIPKIIRLLHTGLYCLMFSTVYAETVKVQVLDVEKKGVKSTVFLSNMSNKVRLGKTNNTGQLTAQYSCKIGDLLKAYPEDRGSYFASEDVDCANSILLHVINRATPYGNADAVQVRTFVRAENGQQVTYKIMARGLLKADAVNVKSRSISGIKTDCDVKIIPTSYVQVYRIENTGSWSQVNEHVESLHVNDTTLYIRNTNCSDATEKIAHKQEDVSRKLADNLKQQLKNIQLTK